MKLSLGLSGLYEYLGQFSIAWQLANVATLPISFDLRVNLNKITDLGSYLKNKNSRKGNYINKKIIIFSRRNSILHKLRYGKVFFQFFDSFFNYAKLSN